MFVSSCKQGSPNGLYTRAESYHSRLHPMCFVRAPEDISCDEMRRETPAMTSSRKPETSGRPFYYYPGVCLQDLFICECFYHLIKHNCNWFTLWGAFCFVFDMLNTWMDIWVKSSVWVSPEIVLASLTCWWLHLRRSALCLMFWACFDLSVTRRSFWSGKPIWCYLVEELAQFLGYFYFSRVDVVIILFAAYTCYTFSKLLGLNY